jgi:membrane protein YqaA with SNARE-associated domain
VAPVIESYFGLFLTAFLAATIVPLSSEALLARSSSRELDRASAWFNRYGMWSLLLAWVPIIGDPITLAAGVRRTRFLPFLLLVAISKTGRYAVLLGTVDWLWP